MATEIERKFLVAGEFPREAGVEMVQAYLGNRPDNTVRVRTERDRAVLTIKGPTCGISRPEFEYAIPLDDARELMKLAVAPPVEKTRYYHRHGNHTWEIDVFGGSNAGLVVAEVELGAEDEEFEKPEWLGEEVTLDPRYSNSSLSVQPYALWRQG